ncbi:hypothetical protein OEZ85_002195 [Tetradesmus obliquus]|uniref:Uncharacterized protein n=1 Tax=Tetradesmus obliquus TaxID=3088 RepID=A0ABY8U2U7_TETOB|nr:hypothetical protein OEZ85_002195 [Tetradesmus obliquus]
MLRAVQKLPGVQAFSSSLTSATDSQDELRLPPWLGRTLALSSEEQATCKRHIEYKDADGRIQQLQVDLAFPANSRTITRLMEAWWGCKGGRPPGSSKRAAAALAGTSKPRFKAMPVSFNNAVEKVMYLEAELLSALKEINAQQLALKERGNPIFDKSKGTSAPPADLMQQHNRPSLYGFRSMHAGEVFLIMRQLLKASLPSDFWEWYIARAGRSAAAQSWRTYVENYLFGFGHRLPYAQHAGRDVQTVTFKLLLLGWCPTLANSGVVAGLDEAGRAQLQQATELAQLYGLNNTFTEERVAAAIGETAWH